MKSKLEKMFSDFKKGWLLLVILILIAPFSTAMSGEAKFKAMSRNLYLGADIFKVIDAAETDPNLVPEAVAEVYQTMLYTNFWARVEAIADEIANAKPQIIGLQEVSTFYIQTPGDFMIGNPIQASTPVIDFYTELDDALQARGMYYDAFTITNADVELPMLDVNAGPPFYLSDIRMVDHDVVLVRKGHHVSYVLTGNYTAKVGMTIEMPSGDVNIEFTRGFVIVDVEIKRETFRFVSTHLEVSSEENSPFRVIQFLQMSQLLATISYLTSTDPKPIIMVGDFNSSPEDIPGIGYVPGLGSVSYTPPYMLAIGAGYLDTWLLQRKYDEGYTSGFDEYVSDPNAELTERIDLVFLDPLDLTIKKVKCDLVGDDVSDMVPNPEYPGFDLWPSDHAGVVAEVKFFKPK